VNLWRRRFGGLDVSETKRLKALEAENQRLKKSLAERDLDIEVLKEVAAPLLREAPSGLRYQSRRALRDAPVVERMRALSVQYPGYGYRRIRIFLARDGTMSSDRAHRLWRAARLRSESFRK
jgi:hypothetical protein